MEEEWTLVFVGFVVEDDELATHQTPIAVIK